MKKNTKIGILIIAISVIMVIVGIFIANIVNKHLQLEKDMETVKLTYTSFSIGIVDNYDIKNKLLSKLNNFNNETYPEEHESYKEILNEYDTNVTEINEDVTILEDLCDTNYKDNSLNIMCDNYQNLYEIMNNDYIKYVTNYNDKLNSYNETSEEDYETHILINKESIDFNQDGQYASAETEE